METYLRDFVYLRRVVGIAVSVVKCGQRGGGYLVLTSDGVHRLRRIAALASLGFSEIFLINRKRRYRETMRTASSNPAFLAHQSHS